MWSCANAISKGQHVCVDGMKTHQVSNVTMLFEFNSGELSHVGPGGGIGYAVGATDNVSPQRYHFLPLDELRKLLDMLIAMNPLRLTRSSPRGFFPRACSRESGFVATVAYPRNIPS